MTKIRKISISIGAIIAGAIAVGGWALNSAPKVASAIDARYVHTARYSVDSVGHAAEMQRIDTALSQLVRACQHRRECP